MSDTDGMQTIRKLADSMRDLQQQAAAHRD